MFLSFVAQNNKPSKSNFLFTIKQRKKDNIKEFVDRINKNLV